MNLIPVFSVKLALAKTVPLTIPDGGVATATVGKATVENRATIAANAECRRPLAATVMFFIGAERHRSIGNL